MRCFWLFSLVGVAYALERDKINLLFSGTSPLSRTGPSGTSSGLSTGTAFSEHSSIPPFPNSTLPQTGTVISGVTGGLSGTGVHGATSRNTAGQTVISNTNGVLTLSTGITTPLATTFPDGASTTITPSDISIPPTTGTFPGVTVENSDSEIVISNTDGVLTLPSGVTTPVTTTFPDGVTTTITPSDITASGVTLENSDSQTVISNTDGAITLSSGISTPITTTFPDGDSTTIFPPEMTAPTTTSSTSPVGFIVPITTPIHSPKPSDGGTVIPCNLWFFFTCIRWDDLNIFGWDIHLPPGIHPPGPPPPISINPKAHFSIHISGPLPDWPRITIGPDHLPTYPPKPSNGPDDECDTQTAELCATSTSFGVSTSDEATHTTTTQILSTCTTVYGCNVEDTSTATTTTAGCTDGTGTASGSSCSRTSATYVVYPRDGTDNEEVNSIAAQLREHVKDTSLIKPSNTKTLGLNYWLLPLNQSSADELQAVQGVASVYTQCSSSCWQGTSCPNGCYDPLTTTVYQITNLAQLSFVPWPPTVPAGVWNLGVRPTDWRKYYFDESSGQHIPLYVYDTGATLDHPDFNLIRNRVRWIHVGLDPDGRQPQDDSINENEQYHGTAMLSLAAGETLGIAKNVDPIIVRLPRRLSKEVGFTPETWLDGLSMINDDLGSQPQTEAKAVVLLAAYYPPEGFTNGNYQGWVARCYAILQDMASKGAIVVTGSGNEKYEDNGVKGQVNGWPANFGRVPTAMHIPSLVVAGALSSDGEDIYYADDIPGGLPNIYAPGLNVKVAEGNPDLDVTGDGRNRIASGTSTSAAMTAGLAAYFLRLVQLGQLQNDDGTAVRNSPQGIKDFMLAKAWSRHQVKGQDRKAIWNLFDPTQRSCPWTPPRFGRREEGNGTCFVPASIIPTSLPTFTSSTMITSTTISSTSSEPPLTTTEPPLTTTEPPPTTTESQPTPTPVVAQPAVCNDENNYPGHADIYGDTVRYLAEKACDSWKSDPEYFGATSAPISSTQKNSFDVHYYYSVEWILGCDTTTSSEDIYSPMGDDQWQCPDIYYHCYKDCPGNGGVGGYIDVGCVRYQFIGGI